MRFNKFMTGLLLCTGIASNAKAQTQLYSNNVTAATARLNWSYDLTPSQNIYYGAHSNDMTNFVADAGKPVAIWQKYVAWGNASWSGFPTSTMNSIRNYGSIPLVTWEPWAYAITDANYQLSDIINGNYDTYITNWAIAAKNWGHPFFLRFAHEMNGKTWYPWQEGLNGNTSGQYVQAWKHVVDIFREVGANNANWVWCANVSFYGSTPMADLYPGDDYVDWVSLDGYNHGTSSSNWKSFSQVYNSSLNELAQLAPGKKIMIAEIGSTENGGSKSAWITDALTTQIQAHPNIKAVVWFNSIATHDYRIQSSVSATASFSSAIASPYFLSNQYATAGALSYQVRYRKVGDTDWTLGTTTQYYLDAADLYPGSEYEFQVRALTASGYTPYSASSFFTTDEVVTGVNDPASPAAHVEYAIYPNPFEGEFNIKVTTPEKCPVEVQVIDTRGALVYSSDQHNSNENISIGHELAGGLYFVHITALDRKWVSKIVKSK